MKQRKIFQAVIHLYLLMMLFHMPILGICEDSQMDINGDGVVGMPDVIMTLDYVANEQQYREKEIATVTGVMVSYLNQEDIQEGLALLTESFDKMGFLALVPDQNLLTTVQQNACASVKLVANQTIEFTFNEQPSCESLSGIVRVKLNASSEGIALTASFDSLSTTRCTLDGDAELLFEFSQNELTIHCKSQSLSICNTALNGLIIFHVDRTTKDVTIEIKGNASIVNNSFNGDIQVDLTIDTDQSINGSATITTQGKVYHVMLTDLYLDSACGMPTSGQIQFNMYQLDFSQTTCENPKVTISMGIFTFEMSMQEVLELLMTLKK
ncbi:MAG: hypothetical protein HQK75_12060 [Candidatus Magnetomorum sp.]|nr:hypothetical protein [Candidatus Magnetomorum sp.]